MQLKMAYTGCKMFSRTLLLKKGFLDSHRLCGRAFLSTVHANSEDENVQFESKENESSANSDFRMDETREKILNAALDFVDLYGWSRKALAAGAESVRLSSLAHGMFPEGGSALVVHFYATCNEKLAQSLEADYDQKLPKSVFLTRAVETRLRMISPYRKQWPQAMGIMALPQNVPVTLNNLLTLVDNILYYADDRSTGFNWYTKRAGLAAVYKGTELIFIQDESADFSDTWSFLEHRIRNWESMSRFGGISKGLLTTIQNTLGIPNTNR